MQICFVAAHRLTVKLTPDLHALHMGEVSVLQTGPLTVYKTGKVSVRVADNVWSPKMTQKINTLVNMSIFFTSLLISKFISHILHLALCASD